MKYLRIDTLDIACSLVFRSSSQRHSGGLTGACAPILQGVPAAPGLSDVLELP